MSKKPKLKKYEILSFERIFEKRGEECWIGVGKGVSTVSAMVTKDFWTRKPGYHYCTDPYPQGRDVFTHWIHLEDLISIYDFRSFDQKPNSAFNALVNEARRRIRELKERYGHKK
jgi:hypothetical protein